MAKFTLSIETEEVHELKGLVDKLAGAGPQLAPAHEGPATEAEVGVERPKPSRPRGRAGKEETTETAPPATSVAQFAAEVKAAAEAPAAAATAPGVAPAAPDTGASLVPVTYEQTKAVLVQVMEKFGGNALRQLLNDTAGVGALSELQPSQYATVHAALTKKLAEG